MDWEAAGKQLVEEEQQAAAKAAARKAKRLRQKLNKRPAQQEQPAVESSSLHHGSDAEAPDADDLVPPYVLNTSPLLKQRSLDILHNPSLLDSQKSDPLRQTSSSQTADSLLTASQGLGSTVAVSIAGSALPSSAAPSSIAEQDAGQKAMRLSHQPVRSANEAVNDDMFLQDLFRCPLTQVSKHCNKLSQLNKPLLTSWGEWLLEF